jgi:hypothetical protein
MTDLRAAAERDTIVLPRALIERALAEHVEPVIDSYSPDCGDAGCDDCTHVLRPAIALRDALRAALAAEQARPVIDAVRWSRFLSDLMTAAGLLAHGWQSKALAERIGAEAMALRLATLTPPPAAPCPHIRSSGEGDHATNWCALNGPPAAEPSVERDAEWVDAVMAQAQVFASAWSLVGSRFDDGEALHTAEAMKAELRAMIAAAAKART